MLSQGFLCCNWLGLLVEVSLGKRVSVPCPGRVWSWDTQLLQEGATVGAVVPCEPRKSCEAGVGGGCLSAEKAHGCRSFQSHLEAPGADANREKARGLGGTPRHGRVLSSPIPALDWRCRRCGCRYQLPLPLPCGGGPRLGRDGRPSSHVHVTPSRKPQGWERLLPGQTQPFLLTQVWLGVMGRCSTHPWGPRGAGVFRARPSESLSLPEAPCRHLTCFLLLCFSCSVLAVCKGISWGGGGNLP